MARTQDVADETHTCDRELVRRGVARDAVASQQLVVRLTPIVQHRVRHALSYHRSTQRGYALERSDVLDLTQHMLLLLFEDGARILSNWEPERGLSLENFVGLVVEREALAFLRSGRRSAWAETPTSDDILAGHSEPSSTDRQIACRDELTKLWQCLQLQLSPRGLALFHALLVEQRPVEEICDTFHMSANALYSFRSRLRDKVREIRESLTTLRALPSRSTASPSNESQQPARTLTMGGRR
jgi:DNA-directed RNA polymerase specialized sigma24 family protein